MEKFLFTGFPERGNLKKLWRIMRLSFVLIIGFVITVSAESYSQTKKMDIKLSNSSIAEVMKFVEKNSLHSKEGIIFISNGQVK